MGRQSGPGMSEAMAKNLLKAKGGNRYGCWPSRRKRHATRFAIGLKEQAKRRSPNPDKDPPTMTTLVGSKQ